MQYNKDKNIRQKKRKKKLEYKHQKKQTLFI